MNFLQYIFEHRSLRMYSTHFQWHCWKCAKTPKYPFSFHICTITEHGFYYSWAEGLDSRVNTSCRGGSCTSAFSQGSGTWGCFWTSGEHTSTGTSLYINNSLLISSLLSCFAKEKYFHGNVGTDKNEELSLHKPLGFFCCERFLKIQWK